MRLKNKIFGVCMGIWSKCGVIHPRLNESNIHVCLITAVLQSRRIQVQVKVKNTYVIKSDLSLSH